MTPKTAHTSFGDLLRAHRIRAGLSVADVAELLDVTENWVCVVEGGRGVFARGRVEDLMRVFGLKNETAVQFVQAAESLRPKLRAEWAAAHHKGEAPDVPPPLPHDLPIAPTVRVLRHLQALQMEPKTLARALMYAAGAILEDSEACCHAL